MAVNGAPARFFSAGRHALHILFAADPQLLSGLLQVSLQADARYLDALAAVDDPTDAKRALDRLTAPKQDAAGRRCRGFSPLARHDAQLFQSLMAGERSGAALGPCISCLDRVSDGFFATKSTNIVPSTPGRTAPLRLRDSNNQ